MIVDALKKRLYTENDRAPGRWMKELPAVVWGLRTQTNRNTGVSPYFMVYGAEAVLPSDIHFGSPRIEHFDQATADNARELEINCMEEKRLDSCLRTAKYLAAVRRYYNRNVKDRSMENKPGGNAQAIHSLGRTFRGDRGHTTHVLQIGIPRRNTSA